MSDSGKQATATVADSAESGAGAAAPNDPARRELLEACQRGNLKLVKTILARQRLKSALKDEALKTAAEFGNAAVFEEILLDHGQPDDQTLRHAVRWALRYQDRRILGAIMQADTGRFVLTAADLQQFKAVEEKQAKPDKVLLYLLERLLSK